MIIIQHLAVQRRVEYEIFNRNILLLFDKIFSQNFKLLFSSSAVKAAGVQPSLNIPMINPLGTTSYQEDGRTVINNLY